MKILLAIDGSDYSKVAVEELARIPFPLNTQVFIISVFQSSILMMSGPEPMVGLAGEIEKADLIIRKDANDIVKKAARLLEEKNSMLSVTTAVIIGSSPKNVILNEAEAFGADLIVIGSQGHGAFSRFLLGSVSQSVAMHANCSVMIVRKPDATEKK